MTATASNVTRIKRTDKTDEPIQITLNIFDMPETNFEQLLQRRAKNRITFLSIVKSALTEGVDYCNLPMKGKKALPTLLKGGGEVVCQILGLTPRIQIAESTDSSITMCCELLDENQQVMSVGFGARSYNLDASSGGRNKTTKMAVKSAYLDAVIRAGALSSLFTMDLEDMSDNNKTIELISIHQVQQLTNMVAEHKLEVPRFINWLSKFNQNHKGSAITELNQLPTSMFNIVLEKIPTLANAAK